MKSFDMQMSSGKISNALQCLDESQKGNVLSLQERVGNKTVMQILQEKHPKPMTSKDSYVTNENDHTLEHHDSIFDKINASTVRETTMVTQGSHGPSGVDDKDWRMWLSHFGQASTNLCKALAAFARRLATEQMHDLTPYNACRLIPLDKNPGVRPIGVGEVIRRIIGRNILRCIGNDLKILGQNRQLCLGQKCGIEHAFHSLRETFELPETEGLLLIDAKNAFNSLNRDLALKNSENLFIHHNSAPKLKWYTFKPLREWENYLVARRNYSRRPFGYVHVWHCTSTVNGHRERRRSASKMVC